VGTKTDRIISVTKDLLLFIGGSAGIGYQQITGNVNIWLLGIFALAAGIPGFTNLNMLLRGTIIKLPSQSQAAPPSLPESDSSSSN